MYRKAPSRQGPSRPARSRSLPCCPLPIKPATIGQEYFADGVTEESSTLSAVQHVAGDRTNAVLPYKSGRPPSEEVVSELGAKYLVGGSVRHSGKRVRIAAQLTESRAGTVMWTDRFDGELTEFSIFRRLSPGIAGTLAANVTQIEVRRRHEHPRPNPRPSTWCCARGRSAM